MIFRSKWWIMTRQSGRAGRLLRGAVWLLGSNRTTTPPHLLRNVPHVEKFPGYNARILSSRKSFSQSSIGPYDWKYVSFPARNSSSQHLTEKRKKKKKLLTNFCAEHERLLLETKATGDWSKPQPACFAVTYPRNLSTWPVELRASRRVEGGKTQSRKQDGKKDRKAKKLARFTH